MRAIAEWPNWGTGKVVEGGLLQIQHRFGNRLLTGVTGPLARPARRLRGPDDNAVHQASAASQGTARCQAAI